MFIYFLRNKANSKVYIGSTNNFERRKIEHFEQLVRGSHCNRKIQEDLKTYSYLDFEMFAVSALGNIPDIWLKAAEEMWISLMYTSIELYNINPYTTSFNQSVIFPTRKERIEYRRFVRKPEKHKISGIINEMAEYNTNICQATVSESPF